MAYKALYRKYRPTDFDSVVGQDVIVKTLKNIIANNKVSHAYLFSGPRGTGKTSVAKIFAKTINCHNQTGGIPCGKCSICEQIESDQISDIIEIDAASNNGVDEIRDLKSKINLVPTVCKYKVYIIDEVHMLSTGAFNALLKTLEEPPCHVVFILATTEIHKLPLTVISRCQNYNFKKITEEQLKKRLDYIISKEKIKIDDEATLEIASVSDGGMRDAIGLLEQLASFTNNNITLEDVELLSASISRKEVSEIIENIVEGNISNIFDMVNTFYQEGKDFTKIAANMIILLKDILLYKKAKNYFKDKSSYDISVYKGLIDKLDDNNIYEFISEINSMIANLKISSNPKIIFEITLLKLIGSKVDVKTTELPDIDGVSGKKAEPNNIEAGVADNKENKHNDDNMVDNQASFKKTKADEEEDNKTKVSEFDPIPFIKMPLYKKNLINNTLATAKKQLLTELNKKRNQLQTFLINKDFKQAATVLLDGKIVGASDTHIIYIYPYEAIVEKADDMTEDIEALIKNITNQKYKIINIASEAWSEIRPYYINLMKKHKKIDILPEIENQKSKKVKPKKKSKEIEEAINIFGEELIEIK